MSTHCACRMIASIGFVATASLIGCQPLIDLVAGPLAVTATIPADGDTSAAGDTPISATFSHAIHLASLDELSFHLDDGAGPVEGTVSYDAATRTLTFTPAQALVLGTHYAATLTAGIRDTRGSALQADHTWTFSTRGGTWKPRHAVGRSSGANARAPIVRSNSRGDVVVLWEEDEGTDRRVWANHLIPGEGWQTAGRVQTTNASRIDSKHLAIDPAGNALAMWLQTPPGSASNALVASRFVAGEGWQAPVVVASGVNQIISDVRAEADAEGDVVVLWRQTAAREDGTRPAVWVGRFSADTGWNTARRLSGPADHADQPTLAVAPTGQALAAWRVGAANTHGIFVAHSASDADGTVPQQIAASSTPVTSLHIVHTPAPNALVVWSPGDQLQFATYTDAAGWSAAGFVAPAAATERAPALVADPDGHATLLWVDARTDDSRIAAARRASDGGWTSPVLLDAGTGGEAIALRVDPLGNVLAAWNRAVAGQYVQLYVSRFTAAGGWSDPVRVGPFAPDTRWEVDVRGNAVFAWPANLVEVERPGSTPLAIPDAPQRGLWVRRYVAGEGLQSAQRLNDVEETPAINVGGVVIDDSGRATVVWSQNAQIYASRFE